MIVAISQPMLFPWVGMFELIRLADIYVHYSDVQFSKGSFSNRVQIKAADGVKWLTVPLTDLHLGQRIDEVRVNDRRDWRQQHIEFLSQAYMTAPFRQEMLALVRTVYSQPFSTLAELSEATMMSICRYFSLDENRRFVHASDLHVAGPSTRRVLDIVLALGGDRYVTGLGARNYLDHELLEHSGVRVEYMNYEKTAYPQLHGAFTPFVSALDLIANVGVEGKSLLRSGSIYWKDYLANG